MCIVFDFSLKIIVFGHNHEVVPCYCFNFDSLFNFLYSLIMRIEASHSFSVNTDVCVRVRTGYGILEKLWNFEKVIPYMEKIWNLSKTAVPMEKLWNFLLVEKNAGFLKKMGGKYVRTSKCGFNVCCFGYHFTRPSSTNLLGYSACLLLDRVNC